MSQLLSITGWAAAAAASNTGAAYFGQHETMAAVLCDAPHFNHPRRLAGIAQRALNAEDTREMRWVVNAPKVSFWGVQVVDLVAKGASAAGVLTAAKALPQGKYRVNLVLLALGIRVVTNTAKWLGGAYMCHFCRGGVYPPIPGFTVDPPPRDRCREITLLAISCLELSADAFEGLAWLGVSLACDKQLGAGKGENYLQTMAALVASASGVFGAGYRAWSHIQGIIEDSLIYQYSSMEGSLERVQELCGGREAYEALPVLDTRDQHTSDCPCYEPRGASIMRGVDRGRRPFVTLRVGDAILTLIQRFSDGCHWSYVCSEGIPEISNSRGGGNFFTTPEGPWFERIDNAPTEMATLRNYIAQARALLPGATIKPVRRR